jgi:uncharacterized alpha-E superfamily protein
MISRVAGSCFWMHRYMERVENMARMLQVNLSFVLDVHIPLVERWRPFLIVAGEEPRFNELVGAANADDGEIVQDYLTWSEENPVSIISSLHWARDNARTIRETISLEMWESLNEFWLWMSEGQGRRIYARDRYAFYARVKDSCQLFHGLCHNTILNAEPFDFMRVGMLLERAGQTSRILDVKYHTFGPGNHVSETPAEVAQWLALLKSCAASESFFKRHRMAMTGPAIAEFLLFDEAFPRSVMHCLTQAQAFLNRIGELAAPGMGRHSRAKLGELVDSLSSSKGHSITVETILSAGVHTELTRIIDTLALICADVQNEYFDPMPESVQLPNDDRVEEFAA